MRPPIDGRAVAQQLLRLAFAAEPDVLVPVELERRREVVDLREVEVIRADAGFFVRSLRDRRPEPDLGRHPRRRAESVEKFGISMTAFGNRGVTVETAEIVTSGSAPPCLRAKSRLDEHDCGCPVGRCADLEQPKRVGDDRRSENLVDRHLLAVPRVRVGQPVPGVLDLHLRRSRPRSRRTGPSAAGRTARSTSGSSRPSGGTAASPGRPSGRRRPGRRSPSASCPHRRRGRRHRARRGSAPGRWRSPTRPTRTRRSTTTLSPRSNRAPARTSRRR